MTKQEYQHIRDLAWLLLADAKISSLPVDIARIARMYNFERLLDYSKTRYANTIMLSEKILWIYGYNTGEEYSKTLAVRLLCPAIVLRDLQIKSAADIKMYCDVPNQIAQHRFERLQLLLKRDKFEQSGMEASVLKNFASWIRNHNQSSSE